MFGSLVEYNCDPGYQLIGERTIICNMAGYWEGQPGYCDRKWHLNGILIDICLIKIKMFQN